MSSQLLSMRATGHADLLALEIGQGLDRVNSAGTMIEPSAVEKGVKVKSAPPLRSMRHPEPIGGDDVDRAALQAHGGGLRAGKRHHVELDALGFVEAIALDGIEDPAHGAEFEDADLDLFGGVAQSSRRWRKSREPTDLDAMDAPSAWFLLQS